MDDAAETPITESGQLCLSVPGEQQSLLPLPDPPGKESELIEFSLAVARSVVTTDVEGS